MGQFREIEREIIPSEFSQNDHCYVISDNGNYFRIELDNIQKFYNYPIPSIMIRDERKVSHNEGIYVQDPYRKVYPVLSNKQVGQKIIEVLENIDYLEKIRNQIQYGGSMRLVRIWDEKKNTYTLISTEERVCDKLNLPKLYQEVGIGGEYILGFIDFITQAAIIREIDRLWNELRLFGL